MFGPLILGPGIPKYYIFNPGEESPNPTLKCEDDIKKKPISNT
jgi:hypothetical protein